MHSTGPSPQRKGVPTPRKLVKKSEIDEIMPCFVFYWSGPLQSRKENVWFQGSWGGEEFTGKYEGFALFHVVMKCLLSQFFFIRVKEVPRNCYGGENSPFCNATLPSDFFTVYRCTGIETEWNTYAHWFDDCGGAFRWTGIENEWGNKNKLARWLRGHQAPARPGCTCCIDRRFRTAPRLERPEWHQTDPWCGNGWQVTAPVGGWPESMIYLFAEF